MNVTRDISSCQRHLFRFRDIAVRGASSRAMRDFVRIAQDTFETSDNPNYHQGRSRINPFDYTCNIDVLQLGSIFLVLIYIRTRSSDTWSEIRKWNWRIIFDADLLVGSAYIKSFSYKHIFIDVINIITYIRRSFKLIFLSLCISYKYIETS